jgi:integrase
MAAKHAGLSSIATDYFRFFDLPLLAFLTDRQGLPLWSATMFLAHISLNGRGNTGDTTRTYAEALLPWVTFLSNRGSDILDANEELLGIYRAQLCNRTELSGIKRFSSATINLRLAVVRSFYAWGQKNSRYQTSLGALLLADKDNGIRPWRSIRKSRSSYSSPRIIKRFPRILSADEIYRVCLLTLPPYKLMLRWCVATGIRRFEVCNLKLDDLPAAQELININDGLVQITLLRKGGREHTIHVPISLVEDTNWYVLTERPRPQPGSSEFVFLNSRGSKVQRPVLSKKFRESADKINSGATLHHLRHTFAVHVLKILEARRAGGDSLNSLKTLQILLGHANSTTTEIYLRAMETTSPTVVAALDYLYGVSVSGLAKEG